MPTAQRGEIDAIGDEDEVALGGADGVGLAAGVAVAFGALTV